MKRGKILNKLLTLVEADLLIEGFLNSQDIRENSKETYYRELQQFKLWLQKTKPKEIFPVTILEFKKHLVRRKMRPLTITNYIIAVKKFLKWIGLGEAVEGVKGEKRDRGFRKDPLTPEQIEDLLKVFDRSTAQGCRNHAIINLMLRTGLRTHEVIHANVQDIRQVGGQAVLYILGKGRKEKSEYVVLTQKSLKPINEYLIIRKSKSKDEPLFTSLSDRNRGERLTTRSIRGIVKDYLRKIGINSERITAHSMRHTALTMALLGGASLQEAMAMGRHKNINTTMIYAHNIDRIGSAAEKRVDAYLEKK